jgi:hypothetical protein
MLAAPAVKEDQRACVRLRKAETGVIVTVLSSRSTQDRGFFGVWKKLRRRFGHQNQQFKLAKYTA